MTRVNFTDVRERFTHIDARFVSCTVGFDDVIPSYTVSLYPWWEHPAHVEAVKAGSAWGFADCEDGYRDVSVYPKGLVAFRLSRCREVIDWSFCDQHALLWPYEDSGQIFCNSDPPIAELLERVEAALLGVSKTAIYSYLDPLLPYEAPFCLGSFPFTLFQIVERELSEIGVATFISRRPGARDTPVLLLIDGCDYITAEDYDIDVPYFEHRPEWFKPGRDSCDANGRGLPHAPPRRAEEP